ncbi:uncharacterized protein LOC143529627 [Bidens hawaiensis]|uniref:uncharacterized protein LOC143529627 n=1 Tax=Bidens hawaiensis TaxID=980011 RepID=UPI0040499656
MSNQLVLSRASDELPDLRITDPELQIKSWNLFAVLLTLGHPVPPIELATRCGFIEATSEFVEFACSVPNSPISLTSDGLVTVSSAVCVVLKRFLLNSSRGLKVFLPMEVVARDGGRKRGREGFEITFTRKRRRLRSNACDQADLTIPFEILDACAKVYIRVDDMLRSVIMNTGSIGISDIDRMLSQIKFDTGNFSYGLNGEHEDEKETATILSMRELGSNNRFSTSISGGFKNYFQFRSLSHLTESSLVRIEDINDERCLIGKEPSATSNQADDKSKVISLVKAWIDNDSSKVANNLLETQRFVEGRECEHTLDSENHKGNLENTTHKTVHEGVIPELNSRNRNTLCCNDIKPCQEAGEHNNVVPPTEEEKTVCGKEEQLDCSLIGEQDHEKLLTGKDVTCKDDCKMKNSVISYDRKHLPESTAKLEAIPKVTNSTVQTVSIKTNKGNDVGSLAEQKYSKKDKRSVQTKQKLKPTCEQTMHTSGRESIKENKEKASVISVKGHSEPKIFPVFESYIVEEEEGSGGYGTVYKTRRKKDGTMFAVKCKELIFISDTSLYIYI